MNSQEAIETLRANYPDAYYEQLREAVDMAISALQAQDLQPTCNELAKDTNVPCKDTISRQAAIDAIHCDITVTGRHNAELVATTIGAFADRIKALPSVDAVEVVRCKECKHKPTGTDRDDLDFPDEKCPCKCDDFWYSWKPSDNWFCGNGERSDNNGGKP